MRADGRALVLLEGASSVLALKVAADVLGPALAGRRVAVLGSSPADWLVIAAFGASLVEAWTQPVLLNGWVYYGAPFNPAGYWKDPHGVVHLRGLVKSGTVGATIFNLPAGYRPANQELFAAISNTALGRCDVTTAGDVQATAGSNLWFSLDGLTFRAV